MKKHLTQDSVRFARRNLVLLQILFILARSIAVGMPAYIPLLKECGHSTSEIFLLEALFVGVLMALQTPTGYLADTWGRKRCIILGDILFTMGLLGFIWAESLLSFLLLQFLLAVGASCVSGADYSLLKQSLRISGKGKSYQRVLAWMLGWAQVWQTIFFLLSGLLIGLGYRAPMVLSAIGYLLYLGIAGLLYEERKSEEAEEQQNASVEEILALGKRYLRANKLVAWLIWAQALTLGTTYIGFWYCIPLLDEAKIQPSQFGYLLAGLSAITAAFNFLAAKLEHSRVEAVGLLFFIVLLASISLPSSGIFSLILIGSALQKVLLGLGFVIFTDRITKEVPEDRQATVLSIGGSILNASQLGLLLGNAAVLYWLESASLGLMLCSLALGVASAGLWRFRSF